jgi:hypothetical protein
MHESICLTDAPWQPVETACCTTCEESFTDGNGIEDASSLCFVEVCTKE